MKKLGLVLTVFMLAISLIACSNGAKNSAKSNDHEGTASSNKNYENELNIATTAQPPILDSATTVSQVAFETLYTLNADYQPTPMLAESYDKSKDGKTYTFHLRKGVKFHNGKEMTSDDVTASMNRWLTINLPERFSDEYKHKILVSAERACTISNTLKSGVAVMINTEANNE